MIIIWNKYYKFTIKMFATPLYALYTGPRRMIYLRNNNEIINRDD